MPSDISYFGDMLLSTFGFRRRVSRCPGGLLLSTSSLCERNFACTDTAHQVVPLILGGGNLAGEDGAAPDDDHHDADDADDGRGKRRDRRDAGDRLGDVAEQPVHALREHQLFALFGRVGLHDPDPAERLVQAARHLRVDLAAFAE